MAVKCSECTEQNKKIIQLEYEKQQLEEKIKKADINTSYFLKDTED